MSIAGRIAAALVAAALVILLFRTVRAAWRGSIAVNRFRDRFTPLHKDLLIALGDDPEARRWAEHEWMPRWGERAVIVDGDPSRDASADRAERDAPAHALLAAIVGERGRLPLAIVVPPRGGVRVVRFWRAFREHERGRSELLRANEALVDAALPSREDSA